MDDSGHFRVRFTFRLNAGVLEWTNEEQDGQRVQVCVSRVSRVSDEEKQEYDSL